jgi:hypothetical protein
MTKITFLAASSALLGICPVVASDCIDLQLAVKNQIAAEQSQLLQIVEASVSASPACSCEIVKAAIEGSVADSATVAAIVETAIMAAPEQISLIAQCAIAVAPDALADVQAVLAKLESATAKNQPLKAANSKSAAHGEVASATSSSEDEVASIGNPLDFPGNGPVGPLKGGPSIAGAANTTTITPAGTINPPSTTGVNPK